MASLERPNADSPPNPRAVAGDVLRFGSPQSFVDRFLVPTHRPQPIFESAEVAALVKFASEQGIDTDDHLLARLFRALREYERDPQSMSTVSLDAQSMMSNAELVLRDYAALTKLTDGVNGRNLLHGRHLIAETRPFLVITVLVFIGSIGSLAYGAWVAEETAADDPLMPPVLAHAIQYYAPFAWGALGSCVYILKRIADEAAANQFDPDKFQGWLTTALLGAILGGTITYVIDPAAFGTTSLSLTAIAFLAGLGTKVVYGGLERMIVLLSEKMNLAAIRKAPSKGDSIAEFLAREITQTDPDTEGEKYAVLVKLLESRSPDR
jgi:hypothetical protein